MAVLFTRTRNKTLRLGVLCVSALKLVVVILNAEEQRTQGATGDAGLSAGSGGEKRLRIAGAPRPPREARPPVARLRVPLPPSVPSVDIDE